MCQCVTTINCQVENQLELWTSWIIQQWVDLINLQLLYTNQISSGFLSVKILKNTINYLNTI